MPDPSQSRLADVESGVNGGRLRLWRVRQRQHVLDAETTPVANGGNELRLVYDGQLVYRRTWPTRDAAVREAATRRAVLERAGWTRHW